MSLPDSYTLKVGAIPAYFDAMLGAEVPERFSIKFLEGIGFDGSNDRLLIGILKELGFLNTDGVPTDRYYQFLDRSQSYHVLAEGIKESFTELFAVYKEANNLNVDDAFNKLRTLYKGEKKDTVIKNIAKTFVALCEVADFSKPKTSKVAELPEKADEEPVKKIDTENLGRLKLDALQYHINIVLPDTRDQAVYDAIFKSLRDHLG